MECKYKKKLNIILNWHFGRLFFCSLVLFNFNFANNNIVEADAFLHSNSFIEIATAVSHLEMNKTDGGVSIALLQESVNISALIPLSGTAGTQVGINGSRFGTTKGIVFFDSREASIISWTDAKIIVNVPSNLGIGAVNVKVMRGEEFSNNKEFIVLSAQADLTAPAAPTNLKVTASEKDLTITWINPKDSDFDRVRVIRKMGNAPETMNEGGSLYEGTGQKYMDQNLLGNYTYYYAVFAFDRNENYSKFAIISSKLKEPKRSGQTGGTDTKPKEATENLEVMGKEAKEVHDYDLFVPLDDEGKKFYTGIFGGNKAKITQKERYSLAMFIHYGTQTTKNLGKGERAGVIRSYFESFNKLPKTESEWEDAIKIANGQYPKQTNKTKETKMKKIFKTVYNRTPNIKNKNDSAAIAILTYGLRPAKRNLDSEKRSVQIYKVIFGHKPGNASEWDVSRAIAYSGAKR